MTTKSSLPWIKENGKIDYNALERAENRLFEAWGKMLPERLAEMDREDAKREAKIIKLNTHLNETL